MKWSVITTGVCGVGEKGASLMRWLSFEYDFADRVCWSLDLNHIRLN